MTNQSAQHEDELTLTQYLDIRSEEDALDNYLRSMSRVPCASVFPSQWQEEGREPLHQLDGAEIYEMELLEEEQYINRLQMESRWMSRLLRLGLRHRNAG